jgi:hypothetical protein
VSLEYIAKKPQFKDNYRFEVSCNLLKLVLQGHLGTERVSG